MKRLEIEQPLLLPQGFPASFSHCPKDVGGGPFRLGAAKLDLRLLLELLLERLGHQITRSRNRRA